MAGPAHPVPPATPHHGSVGPLSVLSAVLLLVVLVLLNVVAARASTRLDLTEEGLYTLSDGTKKLLRNLPDPAAIRVFWGGLEAQTELTRRKYETLLEEMAEASGGRVTVRWVDVSDEAGKNEAEQAQVQKYLFRQRVGDKVVNQEGYSALVVESGSKPPARLEGLVDPSIERKFEYLVASVLAASSRTGQKAIAVIDGAGERMRGQGRGRFEALKTELRTEYGDIVQTWHTLDQPLADNVETLLLLAPARLTDVHAYHLEQFLLRGGRAIVCLDPVDLDTFASSPYAEATASGLESWLEHVGISASTTVAGDADPRLALVYPVWKGSQISIGKSGYWFRVLGENLDRSHPALQDLDGFSIYWPAALSYDAAKTAAAGRKVTVLASTSEDGVRVSDMETLRGAEIARGVTKEKVPLALYVEGPLESLWKGKPAPGEPPPEMPPTPLIPGAAPPLPAQPPVEDDGSKPPAPLTPAPAEPAPPEPAPTEPPPAEPAPAEPAPPAPAPAPEPPQPAGPKGAPGEDPPPPPPPSDTPVPAPAPAPGAPEAPAAPAGPKRLEQGTIRLVVVGDADIASDMLGQQTLGGRPNGLTLDAPFGRGLGVAGKAAIINLIDWTTGEETLLSLRAKAVKPRVIERPDDGMRVLLQWLNLAAIPLLVGFAGLIVFLRRRSQG